MTFSLLDLWEAELTGVVLITLQAEGHQAVALYIPEDSTTPLKEFTSQQAMHDELRDRLQADIGYLDKHLADRDKAPITTRLKDRLMPSPGVPAACMNVFRTRMPPCIRSKAFQPRLPGRDDVPEDPAS